MLWGDLCPSWEMAERESERQSEEEIGLGLTVLDCQCSPATQLHGGLTLHFLPRTVFCLAHLDGSLCLSEQPKMEKDFCLIIPLFFRV